MIILFDMDGTITHARQPMAHSVAKKIGELSKKVDVGIVTGSGLDYVLEQCDILKSIVNIDWEKIHLLPCNGTQWYKFPTPSRTCLHCADMKSQLADGVFRSLIIQLCYEQTVACSTFDELEFFGTFIQYRKSLLNWCPIGRDADYNEEARTKFIEFDNRTNFRKEKLDSLTRQFSKDGLVITLGGHTSFDIYPKGWDKTYALQQFFAEHGRIVFIGDKCRGDGNDRTIYEACYPEAYETSGPDETVELIQRFLDGF